MTYITTKNDIACKFMDCVELCPADAIRLDSERWVEFDRKYVEMWPVITAAGDPHANADAIDGVTNELQTHFLPEPGQKDAL